MTRHAGMEQLGFALARESYASWMKLAIILNIVVIIIIVRIILIVVIIIIAIIKRQSPFLAACFRSGDG